jgi:peptidoglycan/xylan/chitin deacetylase (PgdA/CDA1 family)
MGWEAARALAAAGFRCGSHGLGHRRLATLSREGCREELEGSRRVLEDRLGHAVRHLAYPFGSVDWTVRALAQEAGYRSACSTRKGLSGREDDPLALHRVPVYGEDSLLDFAVRIETGQTARELWKRRTGSVRGWRSRGNGRGTG